MCVGEDRGGRLPAQLLDGDTRVLASSEERLPLLDERANEWAQLVQRGAAALAMLLEREREIGAVLELAPEHDERPEDEPPEVRIEMRRA